MSSAWNRTGRIRAVRGDAAYHATSEAVASDPIVNTLGGARLQELRHSVALAQEFYVHTQDDAIRGVLWHGGNISPMSADADALSAFAQRLRNSPGRAGSIVGRRDMVEQLWSQVDRRWHDAVREYRWSQPLLVADGTETSEDPRTLDSGLRRAVPGEEDIVYPASVAMFREEVGTDPTMWDNGRAYWARVRHLISTGRTYVITDAEGVVFKADVGAVFGGVAQIHGVWVRPAARGRGVARAAMADLARAVRHDHAPVVSLYVNDFNEAARRAYDAAGFREVGQLSTILF